MTKEFPLSPRQRRLWPRGGPAAPGVCRLVLGLRGPLDPERLRDALGAVVADHEILRTRFVHPPGMEVPQQLVEDDLPPRWSSADLRELPEAERRRRWKGLEQEGEGAVDARHGPVVSAVLVAWADGEHRLLLALPEACADRWSLGRLLPALGEAYAGGAAGDDGDEDPLQYVDYGDWLTGRWDELDDAQRDRWSTFWNAWRVRSEEGTEAWGGELPPTGPDGGEGESTEAVLEAAAVARLESLAEGAGAALADVLEAAWITLLYRLAARRPVLLARTFDGRPYRELEDGLGPYAVPLPLQVGPRAGEPFADLVGRVAEARRGDETLQLLEIPEDAVFPFRFEYAVAPPEHRADDLELVCLERRHRGGGRLLGLVAERRGEGLHLAVDRRMKSPVARAATAPRLALLLGAALADPRLPVGRLPLLGEDEERDALLRGGGGNGPAEPVHRRILEVARRHPERTAVVGAGGSLTYRQLDERSAALARWLRDRGVGPEVRVALHAGRSVDALVALLAVLRAGGAFVPLDAAQPAPRLAAMLEDAAPRWVLASPELAPELPESGAQVLILEEEHFAPAAGMLPTQAGGGLDAASPEHLAYVIFTSGSTGRPKGVAVEHRQLAAYVDGVLERLEAPPEARWATVSTFAADLGMTMLFPALATGGTLHLVPAEVAGDGTALAEYSREHRIDCLKIVPAHLEALLAGASAAELLPRRRLVLGGEAASRELRVRLAEVEQEGFQVFNHYGPTETTVGVLAGRTEVRDPERPLPLGRPLRDIHVQVVDAGGMPLPAGLPGELWVGGGQVARGYLGRPRETADRFRPDPAADRSGARVYRTGDLVVREGDWELRFHGRSDDQVKLRGFRIELGEVEAVLEELAEVSRAVAVRLQEGAHERLVAFVVAASEAAGRLTGGELQDELRRRLPDYLVPEAVVVLPRLPLTANGKVDRAALARTATLETASGGEPPQGPAEELIAEMWCELLGRESVSADVRFFDVGGHSLLGIRLLARLRQAFPVDVPLRKVFERPTVQGLVETLADLMGDRETVDEVAALYRQVAGMSEDEVLGALEEG